MRNSAVLVITSLIVAVVASGGVASAGPAGDPQCAFESSGCATRTHTVRDGEWLWVIARQALRADRRSVTDHSVNLVVEMIYRENRRVIGSNPSRLRPGQRLTVRHTDFSDCCNG